jgi:hypothetical protein
LDTYLNVFNSLPNLQLLQATQNIEKSDRPFEEWLSLNYPSQSDRDSFLLQHYINTASSLAFEDFIDFVSTRRKELKKHLVNLLKPSPVDGITDAAGSPSGPD